MNESRAVSRVQPLEPPYAPDIGAALGRMTPPGVPPLALFRTFARSMPFSNAIGPLGRFMLTGRKSGGASFDLRSREIVILRVCALCRCEYEWGVHVAGFQAKAELAKAQIAATLMGQENDSVWSPKDQACIRMCDELHATGDLSDTAFASLIAHFDHDQIMELLALAGWYHAIAYLANGMRVEAEPWAPGFSDFVADET